jgi:selenocysteine-specific elongation factor
LGTSEIIGRISILDKDELAPGEIAYAQFRLEKTVVADFDDRFVVRHYSPVFTIGGGKILNAHPRRHKRFSNEVLMRMEMLEQGDASKIIEQFLFGKKHSAFSLKEICLQISITKSEAEKHIHELINDQQIYPINQKSQTVYLHQRHYHDIRERIKQSLEMYHSKNPAMRGMSKTELKTGLGITVDQEIFNKIMEELKQEKLIKQFDSKIALSTHEPTFNDKEKQVLDQVADLYSKEKFSTTNPEEAAKKLNLSQQEVDKAIDVLLDSVKLVKLEDNIFFHTQCIEEAEQKIREFFNTHDELTVGDCRQLFNNSRKYNVPLLNYFDKLGLTVRQQDVRVLNPDF